MTITTERLREIAEDGFLAHGESKELARALLSAREAVPVTAGAGGDAGDYIDGYQDGFDDCRAEMLEDCAASESITDAGLATESGKNCATVIPEGYKLVPVDMTDAIGEAIAMEANCCGGIALDIYEAALAAAPNHSDDVLDMVSDEQSQEVKP